MVAGRTKSVDTLKREAIEKKEQDRKLQCLAEATLIPTNIREDMEKLTMIVGKGLFMSFLANDNPNECDAVKVVIETFGDTYRILRQQFDDLVDSNTNAKLRKVSRIRKSREVEVKKEGETTEQMIARKLAVFTVK